MQMQDDIKPRSMLFDWTPCRVLWPIYVSLSLKKNDDENVWF